MNYFDTLKVPFVYSIDVNKLTENYFSLQRASEIKSDSSILNEAYNVLKNDIKRAEYFLNLKNISVERISPELAMKMFEMRERYASLINDDERIKFHKDIKKRIKDLISSLKEQESNLDDFVETFGELKFLNSFLEKERTDVYSRN